MTTVKEGDTIKVHYTGRLDDDTVFDTSRNRDPLEFTVGAGRMIAGFDAAVRGMAVGDAKSVSIPPEEAYGPVNDELIAEVPRNRLPDDMDPAPGQVLQAKREDGSSMDLRVLAVNDDSIRVDGNFFLAGKTLNFDIEVMEIA